MYELAEQMPEDHSATRTIENEKLRIDGTIVRRENEDKRQTKRIAREKKPKPRKPRRRGQQ
jgi:hypothetical protein